MMALFERPDISKRNKRIVLKYRSGMARKDIASEEGVTVFVVHDAIKRAVAGTKKNHHCRRCACRRRGVHG